jgi:hypothetical protein
MSEPTYEQIAEWDAAGEWCYIHGHEPVNGHPYLVCGECFHAYMTPEDLVNDYNDILYEGWLKFDQGLYPWIPTYDVNKIYSCAYCAHDF